MTACRETARWSVTWSLVQGAGTVTWADVHDLDSAVEFSADGLYLLRLTATDGALFAHDDVVVRVNPVNLPPVVDAGPDQSITSDGHDSRRNGRGRRPACRRSSDLDVVEGERPGPCHVRRSRRFRRPPLSFSADGDYVLRFAATDSVIEVVRHRRHQRHGGKSRAVRQRRPRSVAAAGGVRDVAHGRDRRRRDPRRAGTRPLWSQVSGPGAANFGSPHAALSTVAFDGPGVYVLRLTASDGDLARSDDVTVQVGAGPQTGPPPSVSLTSPVAGASITQPTVVRGTVASQSAGRLAARASPCGSHGLDALRLRDHDRHQRRPGHARHHPAC